MVSVDQEKRLRQFFRQWHKQHGRSFPWRDPETTPFGVLVAEMLLRQTRAEMVAPVWWTLLARYPSAAELAVAPVEELLELLWPLGLGSQRAVALHEMAGALMDRQHGAVPRSIDALVSLPHVGLYAAHAVACFAFGQHVPVVDVNVMRVLARIQGEVVPHDNRRTPWAWSMATAILPARGVREHNYGLLDFSGQICTSRSPACDRCPLLCHCATGRQRVGDERAKEHSTGQALGSCGPAETT
jgi:A/G-specific adenine glycosylase